MQAQPPAPRPYRTLQVSADAPRDLVEEAYWALVAKARHEAPSEAAYAERVRELNVAYRAITGRGAEAAERDAHRARPAPTQRWGRGRGRRRAEPPSLYDLLRVDVEADREIIELAARVLRADARPGRELKLAYEVLSDPRRRAEYDAAIGVTRGADDPGTAPHADAGPVTDIADDVAVAAAATPRGAEAMVAVDGVSPEAAPGVDDGERGTTASSPAPAGARGAAANSGGANEREGGGRRRWPAIGRLVSRGASEEEITAANMRLLALRPEAKTLEPGPRPRSDAGAAPLVLPVGDGARLRVFGEVDPAATRALSVTGVDGETPLVNVGLASGDGDAIGVRVWRRGGEYFLQHVEGPAPTVAGTRSALPIMVLDDGDEIECGDVRLRFELMPGVGPA